MGTLDYRALAVLDAVASHGSFEKAALALGISQSAVSQRIKALEDASGRLLIVRGAPAVPTGLGQRLVSHYRNVKLMEASLDIDLGNKRQHAGNRAGGGRRQPGHLVPAECCSHCCRRRAAS
jgi:LysR family transcriptional regulator (chromosome initiation inhibitor)